MSTIEGTQAASSPAFAPSTEVVTQPTETTAQPTDANGQGGAQEHVDDYTDVPFHQHPRFQQLLNENREFKTKQQEFETYRQTVDPWRPLVDGIRQQFESPEQFQQHLQSQQRAQWEQGEIYKAAQELDTKVRAGQMEASVAEAEFRTRQLEIRLDAQLRESRMVTIGTQLATLQTTYPEMNRDEVQEAVMRGDDLNQAAKRSHDKYLAYKNRVISEYVKSTGQRQQETRTTPEGGSGGAARAASTMPDADKDPAGFNRWMSEQAEATRRAYYGY